MIPFILTISVILGIIVISISLMTYAHRRNISPMTGMMAAMGVAMSVSLTIGVLLGMFLQGNLITSTIISMAVGVIAGLLVGLPTSTLAVVDGVLSGIMGGMMGAMLGVMISLEDAILLVKILLSLTICISIVFTLLFNKERNEKEQVTFKWLLKPIATFILLILLFMGIDQINVSSKNPGQTHSHHENGNSPPNQAKTIEIVTSNFKYSPSEMTVISEETLELKLINSDGVEHDIEIVNFPHEKSEESIHQHDSHVNHSQKDDGTVLHLHVQPESLSSLTLTPLKKGTYEFYCTIPGHRESGMVGTLIVN